MLSVVEALFLECIDHVDAFWCASVMMCIKALSHLPPFARLNDVVGQIPARAGAKRLGGGQCTPNNIVTDDVLQKNHHARAGRCVCHSTHQNHQRIDW